ncbi:RNA polymerase sigma factor [Sphingobacterium gobiense]|nr:RNA polymerase sigma-70 factor [Sphingobacterium gobiense]
MAKSYNYSEEQATLLLLKQGNLDAFNTLYNEHGRKLFIHIQQMTKDEDATEELLQDVFMKVWDNRSGIDASRPFRPWLYTIARNTVYNYYRQVAKDHKIQEQLYLHFEDLYHLETDEDIRDKQEALLARALDTLTERRRTIFTLCKIEGKSYEEVASRLGISVSTVSNMMVKSNQQIRRFVQEHYDELLMILLAIHLV